jgi:hypothetical protein
MNTDERSLATPSQHRFTSIAFFPRLQENNLFMRTVGERMAGGMRTREAATHCAQISLHGGSGTISADLLQNPWGRGGVRAPSRESRPESLPTVSENEQTEKKRAMQTNNAMVMTCGLCWGGRRMCGRKSGRRHEVASGYVGGRLSCSSVGVWGCDGGVCMAVLGCDADVCRESPPIVSSVITAVIVPALVASPAPANQISSAKRKRFPTKTGRCFAPIVSAPGVPVAITRYLPRNFSGNIPEINVIKTHSTTRQPRREVGN